MQSVGHKKTKTHRKRCNATITRVLNTSGANYKINLNRDSRFKLILYIYIYKVIMIHNRLKFTSLLLATRG